MPQIKKLQKLLLKRLTDLLVENGFGGKPSGQTFYVRKPFGCAAFHLTFIDHDDTDFDVSADVALRFDAVENLVNEKNKFLTASEKLQTATIGCELGNLSKGKQKRWNVSTENDVENVAASIHKALTSIALPYIERFSNLEEVFTVLSSNERTSWLHSPIHGARCQRAIALGKILGKELSQLIENNENFLKSRNDFALPDFQKFSNEIREKILSLQQIKI